MKHYIVKKISEITEDFLAYKRPPELVKISYFESVLLGLRDLSQPEKWAVLKVVPVNNDRWMLGLASMHRTKYNAWKEARRLARGAGGKATLSKGVSNVYAHTEDNNA